MVNINPISTVSRSSLIGVGIACGGNILISLALTLQKLAHRRNQEAASRGSSSDSDDDQEDQQDRIAGRTYNQQNGHHNSAPSPIPEENTPSPSPRKAIIPQDGTAVIPVVLSSEPLDPNSNFNSSSSSNVKRRSPSPSPLVIPQTKHVQLNSPEPSHQFPESDGSDSADGQPPKNGNGNGTGEGHVKEGEYLKSKLWWLGQILITIGEGGNFLSYGFAPASVVAPLGTVALIANCIFAPLILRERFHKRELFGMALAIIGAITVVWSSNGSNPRLNPSQLIAALKRLPFIIYTILTILLLISLIILSNSSYGHRYLLVDIGVCTLFGGYTVLSTKALSSLLSNDFFGSWNYGITWFLVVMVAGTSIGQVRWLNRALMRFQSKEVIPTQFVFFSLAGSAVLYEEFKDVPFSSFVNFAFGIATTFLGVHLLTSSPSSSPSDESDTDSIHSSSRPGQPQRASSSASLNLLLPSTASTSIGERAPLLIASPSSLQTQTPSSLQQNGRLQSYTYGTNSNATPTSNNIVRLVRIGSNGAGEFSPALGIGSQAGLLLLATTPPSGLGSIGRGRSTSRAMTLGTFAEAPDAERGSSREGRGRRNTSASRRTGRD
uniref:DUF803-domain-containing protein n=1 Tax=Kwoniella bestiolae CBS 10118 TaxID=1296100 RepID=A0A1B9FV55_9TREE|nr:hypothetical protein I302_08296 [Kwoniella bestiolae CBS 10118]OCF22645.1 hypothetical protein I302_08296 [Kwoniella bestiolae CBS 10118]